jgi:hypothetical protein
LGVQLDAGAVRACGTRWASVKPASA